jgi:hypothetical protein
LLITRLTCVSGPWPFATARTAMSRSVIIPISLSLSATGSEPMSQSSISAAASWIDWLGWISITSRVIASLTFMGSPFRRCRLSNCSAAAAPYVSRRSSGLAAAGSLRHARRRDVSANRGACDDWATMRAPPGWRNW